MFNFLLDVVVVFLMNLFFSIWLLLLSMTSFNAVLVVNVLLNVVVPLFSVNVVVKDVVVEHFLSANVC